MSNDTWLSQLFLQRPLPIDAHCTIHIGLPPWPPTRGCGDIGVHTEVRTITTWNVPTRCLSTWSTKAGHPPGLMPIRSATSSSAPGSQPGRAAANGRNASSASWLTQVPSRHQRPTQFFACVSLPHPLLPIKTGAWCIIVPSIPIDARFSMLGARLGAWVDNA